MLVEVAFTISGKAALTTDFQESSWSTTDYINSCDIYRRHRSPSYSKKKPSKYLYSNI